MTYQVEPHAVSTQHPEPITLMAAVRDFLQGLPQTRREQTQKLLYAFQDYLGQRAPLLAYTKLTGEAWRRTLPAPAQAEAGAILDEFRAYLRQHGWLDAARPVNLLD